MFSGTNINECNKKIPMSVRHLKLQVDTKLNVFQAQNVISNMEKITQTYYY